MSSYPQSGRLGGMPPSSDRLPLLIQPSRDSVSSGGGGGRRRWGPAKGPDQGGGEHKSKGRRLENSDSVPVSLSLSDPLSVDCPFKGSNLNEAVDKTSKGSERISAKSLWDDLPRLAMRHCSSFGSFARGCFRPTSDSVTEGFDFETAPNGASKTSLLDTPDSKSEASCIVQFSCGPCHRRSPPSGGRLLAMRSGETLTDL